MPKPKIVTCILFVLLVAFLGLFLGALIGKFFVPAHSGLAGPAILLGYGVIGLLLALVTGILLSRKLTNMQRLRTLLGVGCAALVTMGFLVYRLIIIRQHRPDDPAFLSKPMPTKEPLQLCLFPAQPLYFGIIG